MSQKDLSELSDQELLVEAKKVKSTAIMNAVLIGVVIGIVLYSIFKNGFGVFILFPLYFVHRMVNNSKYDDKDLEVLLKERNLK